MRLDKFKVGDMVTWADDGYATMTDGRKLFGDGPFKIIETTDVTCHFLSVGHTQHVYIDEKKPYACFSGAFFKKSS